MSTGDTVLIPKQLAPVKVNALGKSSRKYILSKGLKIVSEGDGLFFEVTIPTGWYTYSERWVDSAKQHFLKDESNAVILVWYDLPHEHRAILSKRY